MKDKFCNANFTLKPYVSHINRTTSSLARTRNHSSVKNQPLTRTPEISPQQPSHPPNYPIIRDSYIRLLRRALFIPVYIYTPRQNSSFSSRSSPHANIVKINKRNVAAIRMAKDVSHFLRGFIRIDSSFSLSLSSSESREAALPSI